MSRPPKDQINGLIALVSRGDLTRALQQGEALAQQYPDVPFVLNMLGAINFGLGRLEQAADAYRRVLAIRPDHSQALNNLGIALDQMGEPEQAVASYRKALEIKPDLGQAHANLGNALVRAGQIDQAVASYQKAVELVPSDAETHTNLGNAFSHLEQWEKAADSYFNAFKLAPATAETLVNMGTALSRLDRWHEAATCFRQALSLKPDYARAHYNLGGALDSLGRHEEAIASFDQAIAVRPDYAEAYNNRGIVLGGLGKSARAIESFRKAIELRPDFAEAHRNLSALIRYQVDDPHVVEMRELLARPALSDQDRINLNFASGKAFADLNDSDQAFAFFAEGNRLQKQRSNYELSPDIDRSRRVIAAFSKPLPEIAGIGSGRQSGSPNPVLIVGMPRSGTTLVEQILASHSKVHGTGETKFLEKAVNAIDWLSPDLSPERIQAICAAYRADLKSIGRSAPYVTDKDPLNFWWLGFVLSAMPEARIVHVRRDARATCWSVYRHYLPNRGLGFSNDFIDLAGYYRIYLDLMEFWHSQFPERIYDLDYQSLTESQSEQTRKLLEYVGLDWEDQCLNFHRNQRSVRTLSAHQVRQAMYQGSSDQWRDYERHLAPMIELLQDL